MIIKKFLQLLLLLLIIITNSCNQSNEKMESLAREKMNAGKFAEAISVLSEIMEKESNNATYYNMRGVAYYNLKENSKALTDFDKAIEIQSDDYRFYYNRGNLKRTLNRPESAVEDYNIALELEKSEYEIFLNRALSLMAAHNLPAAIEDFNTADQLSKGKDSNVFFYRGKAYMITEEFNKALEDFTKCININSENGEAYYGRALAKINIANGNANEDTCKDIEKSKELGYQLADQLKETYCK